MTINNDDNKKQFQDKAYRIGEEDSLGEESVRQPKAGKPVSKETNTAKFSAKKQRKSPKVKSQKTSNKKTPNAKSKDTEAVLQKSILLGDKLVSAEKLAKGKLNFEEIDARIQKLKKAPKNYKISAIENKDYIEQLKSKDKNVDTSSKAESNLTDEEKQALDRKAGDALAQKSNPALMTTDLGPIKDFVEKADIISDAEKKKLVGQLNRMEKTQKKTAQKAVQAEKSFEPQSPQASKQTFLASTSMATAVALGNMRGSFTDSVMHSGYGNPVTANKIKVLEQNIEKLSQVQQKLTRQTSEFQAAAQNNLRLVEEQNAIMSPEALEQTEYMTMQTSSPTPSDQPLLVDNETGEVLNQPDINPTADNDLGLTETSSSDVQNVGQGVTEKGTVPQDGGSSGVDLDDVRQATQNTGGNKSSGNTSQSSGSETSSDTSPSTNSNSQTSSEGSPSIETGSSDTSTASGDSNPTSSGTADTKTSGDVGSGENLKTKNTSSQTSGTNNTGGSSNGNTGTGGGGSGGGTGTGTGTGTGNTGLADVAANSKTAVPELAKAKEVVAVANEAANVNGSLGAVAGGFAQQAQKATELNQVLGLVGLESSGLDKFVEDTNLANLKFLEEAGRITKPLDQFNAFSALAKNFPITRQLSEVADALGGPVFALGNGITQFAGSALIGLAGVPFAAMNSTADVFASWASDTLGGYMPDFIKNAYYGTMDYFGNMTQGIKEGFGFLSAGALGLPNIVSAGISGLYDGTPQAVKLLQNRESILEKLKNKELSAEDVAALKKELEGANEKIKEFIKANKEEIDEALQKCAGYSEEEIAKMTDDEKFKKYMDQCILPRFGREEAQKETRAPLIDNLKSILQLKQAKDKFKQDKAQRNQQIQGAKQQIDTQVQGLIAQQNQIFDAIIKKTEEDAVAQFLTIQDKEAQNAIINDPNSSPEQIAAAQAKLVELQNTQVGQVAKEAALAQQLTNIINDPTKSPEEVEAAKAQLGLAIQNVQAIQTDDKQLTFAVAEGRKQLFELQRGATVKAIEEGGAKQFKQANDQIRQGFDALQAQALGQKLGGEFQAKTAPEIAKLAEQFQKGLAEDAAKKIAADKVASGLTSEAVKNTKNLANEAAKATVNKAVQEKAASDIAGGVSKETAKKVVNTLKKISK